MPAALVNAPPLMETVPTIDPFPSILESSGGVRDVAVDLPRVGRGSRVRDVGGDLTLVLERAGDVVDRPRPGRLVVDQAAIIEADAGSACPFQVPELVIVPPVSAPELTVPVQVPVLVIVPQCSRRK